MTAFLGTDLARGRAVILARTPDASCERCGGIGAVSAVSDAQAERDGADTKACPLCGGSTIPGLTLEEVLAVATTAEFRDAEDYIEGSFARAIDGRVVIRLEVIGEQTAITSRFDADEVALALIPETHRALVRESAEERGMTPFEWLLAAIEVGAEA